MFSKFYTLFTGRGGFGNGLFRNGPFGMGVTKGLRFDGVDDYINFGDVFDAETVSFTAMLWCQNYDFSSATDIFISKGAGTVSNAGYRMFSTATAVLARISDGTSVTETDVFFALSTRRNRYICYAFTVNTASNRLDGSVKTAGATTVVSAFGSASFAALGNVSTGAPFTVGGTTTGASSRIILYGLKVWLTAYSSATVRGIMIGTFTVPPNHQWDFNNIQGNTLVDTIGGVNGTIVGAVETPVNNISFN